MGGGERGVGGEKRYVGGEGGNRGEEGGMGEGRKSVRKGEGEWG